MRHSVLRSEKSHFDYFTSQGRVSRKNYKIGGGVTLEPQYIEFAGLLLLQEIRIPIGDFDHIYKG